MDLTVAICMYNAEKYIKKCVDSILAQTYPQVEIILVNDGSSDSSGIICDEYTEKYDHIKVVHKSNGGITSARLEGVKIAAGEYITFVDSDDWIERDYYEILCKEIRDCDFVTSGIYRYFTDEKWLDITSYDLCIDSSRFTETQAVQILKAAYEDRYCPESAADVS